MAYCTNCLHKAAELYILRPGSYTVTPLGHDNTKNETKMAWTSNTDNANLTLQLELQYRNKSCVENEAPPCCKNHRKSSLFDIPWRDVLFPRILDSLDLPELFRLRRVSHECKLMIGEYFKQMTVVDLSPFGYKLNAAAFDIISCDMKSIKQLNLANCKWLTNEQLGDVCERNHKQLELLDISGCFEIDNATLSNIVKMCYDLKRLRLKDCHWLSSATLSVIAENCPNLEEVSN